MLIPEIVAWRQQTSARRIRGELDKMSDDNSDSSRTKVGSKGASITSLVLNSPIMSTSSGANLPITKTQMNIGPQLLC